MSRYYIYDSFTDTVAEFAKKKDNRRRNAMIGAGSVAGLGAIGAGVRYGGAALKGYQSVGDTYGTVGERMKYAGSRAKRRLLADVNKVRRSPGRVKRAVTGYDYAGAADQAGKTVKSYAGMAGNTLKGMAGTTKGRLALGAAGLGALGALGGGAYLGAKAMNKRKRDRNSIRGRVRALLGR